MVIEFRGEHLVVALDAPDMDTSTSDAPVDKIDHPADAPVPEDANRNESLKTPIPAEASEEEEQKEPVESDARSEEGTEPQAETETESETEPKAGTDTEAKTAPPPPQQHSDNTGFKIALLALVIALAALAAVLVTLLLKRRRRRREEEMLIDARESGRGHTISPIESSASDVKLISTAEDCPVRIGSIHGIGRRSSQQDAFGISDVEHADEFVSWGILAVVADGMGGLKDGDRISRQVVVTMLDSFDKSSPDMPPASTLLGLVNEANTRVNAELGAEKLGKCGSTLTAVCIKDQKLYWISVGDSHIYAYRDGTLMRLNQEHNYGAELDARAERGEISAEEALADPQRAALTSYIGIGTLELIDHNENPIALRSGDRILLASDGVFGTVEEARIEELMRKPLKQSCMLLERAILDEEKKNQDNYTCVILEVV